MSKATPCDYFTLSNYIKVRKSGVNTLLLTQRFQINLTREVMWCSKLLTNHKLPSKTSVMELWKKLDVFEELTDDGAKSAALGITEQFDSELSQRLTFYATQLKSQESGEDNESTGSASENNIPLEMFFTDTEIAVMRTYPVPVSPTRAKRLFDMSDVLYENGKIIKGKIRGIVNVGAIHKNNEVMQTLIWTNDLFSNNTQLLKCVIDCFEVSCISDSVDCQIARSRMVGSLKYWVESCLFDEAFLKHFKVFLHKLNCYGMNNAKSTLAQALNRRLEGMEKEYTRNVERFTQRVVVPPSLYTDQIIRLELFDPKEIAKTLTVIGFEMFSKVKVNELLRWNQQNKETHCKSILAITHLSNKIVQIFTSYLLDEEDLIKRVIKLEFICAIGNEAEYLHNFDLLVVISFVFGKSAIHRLKKTFEALSTNAKAFIERLQKLTSPANNWAELRKSTEQDENVMHALPYLGTFLSDTTFINEGNKSTFGKGNEMLINYSKCNMLRNIAQKIYHLQQVPYYDLNISNEIKKFLITILAVENTEENAKEIDEVEFLRSKKIEPTVKRVVTENTEGNFEFLRPDECKTRKYKTDTMDVETFVNALFPTIAGFVSFIAINTNSFVGFGIKTPISMLCPAKFFTIYYHPVEYQFVQKTATGWFNTKILIDASRSVRSQMCIFNEVLANKVPFFVIVLKEDKSSFVINSDKSPTEVGMTNKDSFVAYPFDVLPSKSFGFSADEVLFETEKNHFLTLMSVIKEEWVEELLTGVTLNKASSSATVILAGSFLYVYMADTLARAYPLNYINFKMTPLYKSSTILLELTALEKFVQCPLTDKIYLKGSKQSVLDLLNRIDKTASNGTTRIGGLSLKKVIQNTQRRVPELYEDLINSIASDDTYKNENNFDNIDVGFSKVAWERDGLALNDFQDLSVNSRIGVLLYFMALLPDSLIPKGVLDAMRKVIEENNTETLRKINTLMQDVGFSSSLLSALIHLFSAFWESSSKRGFKKYFGEFYRVFSDDNVEDVVSYLIEKCDEIEFVPSTLEKYEDPTQTLFPTKFPDYQAIKEIHDDMTEAKQLTTREKNKPIICSFKQAENECFEPSFKSLLNNKEKLKEKKRVEAKLTKVQSEMRLDLLKSSQSACRVSLNSTNSGGQLPGVVFASPLASSVSPIEHQTWEKSVRVLGCSTPGRDFLSRKKVPRVVASTPQTPTVGLSPSSMSA
ncbi:rasgef domain containing protein, partial [Entamoeba invadens IP1]